MFDNLKRAFKDKDVDIVRKTIEVGDYLLPDGIAIERKKDDIVSSMLSKRIFRQLSNLTQFENPYLVVTCPNKWKLFYESKTTRYGHIDRAFWGLLASASYSFGVNLVIVDTDEELVEFIKALYKQATKDGKAKRPVKKFRKKVSVDERKRLHLARVRGMSYDKADMLIKKYGSIRNIADLTKNELEKNKGIGKKTSKYILEELN